MGVVFLGHIIYGVLSWYVVNRLSYEEIKITLHHIFVVMKHFHISAGEFNHGRVASVNEKNNLILSMKHGKVSRDPEHVSIRFSK